MLKLYKEKITIDEDKISKFIYIKKIIKDISQEKASKLITYIFLVYDRGDENPIRDFTLKERIPLAKKLSFGKSNTVIKNEYPDNVKLIEKAIKEYEGKTIDKIQKDVDLYDKKMHQFIVLLTENEPEIIKNTHDLNGRVTFSTNIDIINTVLDNSINIILDKAALVMMQKTGKFSNELRGSLSPNIKGKLKI